MEELASIPDANDVNAAMRQIAAAPVTASDCTELRFYVWLRVPRAFPDQVR